MGVPAFFRWLSRKYPSVIVYCVEEKSKKIDGVTIPVDSSKPNPNDMEFDNLYLDMNGIIHPCTHPEDRPAPKDEDEMMIAIFECIDRLFSIVRPRKVLYMAIDGVAPRAKMNQQRSRRFRAAKETTEKIEEIARLRSSLTDKGAYLPPEKPKEAHFDSNCITPGTPFMDRLSTCLNYYIHDRLNNDPGWKGIKVILSDANVPGEGEHKIMDYIRKQRAQPDHDPNTQHCLCGADADLIMLGLATHEPNFTIIREEFRPNKPRPCDICQQLGHEMKDCVGCPKLVGGAEEQPSFGDEVPFIFVRLSVLREYLERELTMPNLPFRYDFERAVDDWVFMCFFVGNDFLPHLPSLEIREGAIDRLVNLYKNCVYKTGGFVTDSGDVNLGRVQLILNELGKAEDEIFKKRQQTEKMFKQREKARKKFASQKADGRPAWIPTGQFAPTPLGLGRAGSPLLELKGSIQKERQQSYRTESAAGAASSSYGNQRSGNRGVKRPHAENETETSDEEDDVNDEVRLWEDGFKDRYYESKFDVNKVDIEFRIKVAHEYVRGLCWVLRYYYQGCASWKWYFPYHYAPFASDFLDIGALSTSFERGTQPFQPLEQLMGVFPAASSSHVPKPWAELMEDPDSPIIDFYPIDFKIDLNGKKFAWQGVALLPFVDEMRLFKALRPYYNKLTPAERKRNIRGDDKVYLGIVNKGYSFLKGIYENPAPEDEEIDFSVDGMTGKILFSHDCIGQRGNLLSPVRNLPGIEENVVLCARFRDPQYSSDFIFKAKRLKGAVDPQRVLKPENMSYEQNRNWRPQTGMVPTNRNISIGAGGHRMLDHYNNRNAQGIYSQVPPPRLPPPAYASPRQFHIGQQDQSYSGSYGYSTTGSSGSGTGNGGYNVQQRHFQQSQQQQGNRYSNFRDNRRGTGDRMHSYGSNNTSRNFRENDNRFGRNFGYQNSDQRNRSNFSDRNHHQRN